MRSLFCLFWGLLARGLEDIQDACTGQLAGIAAQGQVQGQAGQVLGGGLGWQGLGGLIQGPVQGLEEVGVQLSGGFSRFSPAEMSTFMSRTESTRFKAHTAVR